MSLNVRIVGAALICLSAAAFAADPPAQEQTFTDIEPGADVINPDKLIPLLDRGDVRAMNNIGLLWARGIGVPAPDYKEALRWWKEAARRGYVVSMNNLGLLYANGQGVEQDYAVAMNWWKMAAERGNAWAMNSVGDLYEHGLGVQQSYAEALAWYEKAAAAGDGLAMYNLGALYESGHGIEQNYKAAYDWYNRSADKGIGSAMYNLGRMLEAGRGLPRDHAEAYAWLTLAARYFGAEDGGEAKANEDALKAIAPALTSLERTRAEELIQNLTERIETRRRTAPIKAGPGESET
jgi:TPR repeat protein